VKIGLQNNLSAWLLGRIRDHPIAPRSPWQNGNAERLIGSIRRECLDHIVIFGEARLRQVLTPCPDASVVGQGRAGFDGSYVVLGGLHH
jgi:transposase InsO family protein